jgi:hypothetical protein
MQSRGLIASWGGYRARVRRADLRVMVLIRRPVAVYRGVRMASLTAKTSFTPQMRIRSARQLEVSLSRAGPSLSGCGGGCATREIRPPSRQPNHLPPLSQTGTLRARTTASACFRDRTPGLVPLQPVTENPDPTVTITLEEVADVDRLNERLAELGMRAKALLVDPNCTDTVEEVEWGELYPQIVPENGPERRIRIQPDAIPVDHTLVLAVQPAASHGVPPIIVRLMLVQGPAPERLGKVLYPAAPPPRRSELGALLELRHRADAPFETVPATCKIWSHGPRMSAAFLPDAKERGGSVIQVGREDEEPVPDETEELLRIWRSGDRVREERDGGQSNGSYAVRVGDLWWHWDDRNGASSNEDDPQVGSGIGEQLSSLLDPTRLLDALRWD